MTKEQHIKFLQLASALSPENLHCDGEISRAEAKRKRVRLMKQWCVLEEEVGRTVSEEEVWAQFTRTLLACASDY